MKHRSSIILVAILSLCFAAASVLNIAVKGDSYTQTYPAVVCPPTLSGLNSQISVSSRNTQYQRLENRSSKTIPFKVLRFPVSKAALLTAF